jgi:hypothetical protein
LSLPLAALSEAFALQGVYYGVATPLTTWIVVTGLIAGTVAAVGPSWWAWVRVGVGPREVRAHLKHVKEQLAEIKALATARQEASSAPTAEGDREKGTTP